MLQIFSITSDQTIPQMTIAHHVIADLVNSRGITAENKITKSKHVVNILKGEVPISETIKPYIHLERKAGELNTVVPTETKNGQLFVDAEKMTPQVQRAKTLAKATKAIKDVAKKAANKALSEKMKGEYAEKNKPPLTEELPSPKAAEKAVKSMAATGQPTPTKERIQTDLFGQPESLPPPEPVKAGKAKTAKVDESKGTVFSKEMKEHVNQVLGEAEKGLKNQDQGQYDRLKELRKSLTGDPYKIPEKYRAKERRLNKSGADELRKMEYELSTYKSEPSQRATKSKINELLAADGKPPRFKADETDGKKYYDQGWYDIKNFTHPVLNEKGKKVLAAANKKLTTRIDLSPYGAGVISVENNQKAFDEVRKNINSAKESASLAFPKSQFTITGGNEKQWKDALKSGDIDQATYDLLTGTDKKRAKLTTPSDTSRSAIQKQMESYNLMSKSMATPMPRMSKPNKPITKEQSAKIGKGLKSAKNVLSGGKKTAKALSPMTKTAKKRKEFYRLMAEMEQPSQGQSTTNASASKPVTKEQSAKIDKGLKSAKNVLGTSKKTAKALSPMGRTSSKQSQPKLGKLSNPVRSLTIPDYPLGGNKRGEMRFWVESHPTKGERIVRQSKGSKPKYSTYSDKYAIATGENGRTFLVSYNKLPNAVTVQDHNFKEPPKEYDLSFYLDRNKPETVKPLEDAKKFIELAK